jgi:anti-sigma factor RsiW
MWQQIDGALTEAARRELDLHLEDCTGCRAAFEAARDLDRALSEGSLAFPRPGFGERVLLGIAAGASGEPSAMEAEAGRRRARAREQAGDWWVLGGGMAAAALVGIGSVAILPPLLLRTTSAAAAPGARSMWADLASQITRLLIGPEGAFAGILGSPLALAFGGLGVVMLVSLGLVRLALSRPATR